MTFTIGLPVSGLTKRQYEAFRFIKNYSKQTGFSPSYHEIAEALNLHSKSGVHRVIHELAERGLISILPGHSRSIRLTTIQCPHCGHSINL
jgi:repressor LexA